MAKIVVLVILCMCVASALGQGQSTQLEQPTLPEDRQRRLFDGGSDIPFKLGINTVAGTNKIDNAAMLQLKGDRAAFPFLSTLPNGGSAVYITVLKPCGLIMPHTHPRATEQYLIISGQMEVGLAEEVTGRGNFTGTFTPGQSFLVPQGLLHHNTNRQCTPLVFAQIFDYTDPGVVNVINALAALGKVDPDSLAASGVGNLTASNLGGNALDQSCLAKCGITGSTGGGLGGLSPEMQAFTGLASSPIAPVFLPPNASPASGTSASGPSVAPSGAGGSTPLGAGGSTPSDGGSTPSGSGGTTPSGSGGSTPSGGGTTPSGSGGTTPSGSGGSTPSGGGSTPSGGGTTPSGSGGSTPSGGGTTPSGSGGTTPSGSGGSTPSGGGSTPSGGGSTPSGGGSTPSGGGSTPSGSGAPGVQSSPNPYTWSG